LSTLTSRVYTADFAPVSGTFYTNEHTRPITMSRLLFIRHGQASLGKANYDQLSELGVQQSQWLGEYLADQGIQPDHIIIGELARHRQTADALCTGLDTQKSYEIVRGWNEFDFHYILKAYLAQYPEEKVPVSQPKDFFAMLRKGIKAWSENRLNGELPETWAEFEHRVSHALTLIQQQSHHATIAVVSSGGAISMALKHILRLDNEALIDLNLQTRNTAVTECFFNDKNIYLTSFNTIPHLDNNARRKHITFA